MDDKARTYVCDDKSEITKRIKQDIADGKVSKERAKHIMQIHDLAFDCVGYIAKKVYRSDLDEETMVDVEISIFQSVLGTNILRLMRLVDGGEDLSDILNNYLNITLNHLGYEAQIRRRSKN